MIKKSLEITDADRLLFRQTVATIRPHSTATQVAPRLLPMVVKDFNFETTAILAPVAAETKLHFAKPGVQYQLQQKLKRGQLAIDASIDLHGQTVSTAQQSLRNFLLQAVGDDDRCVCVIHGKNRYTQDYPILKNRVNHWLPQHPVVLAFCSALPRDGGTGAVYVLLKHF